jgi:raffinose/stachyose/melibiose transport system permease protein
VSAFRYTTRTFMRELLLLAVGLFFLVPFLIALNMSVKTGPETYNSPLAVSTHPHWSNYSVAWKGASGLSLSRALVNSLIITACTVVLLIIIGSACAYVLARRESKLSTGLFMLFLFGIIVPFQLTTIPLYVGMRKLHLIGTFPGIIILQVGIFLPLTIFLYTGFIRTLPRSYEEAAQVDGASFIRTYTRVVFPLLRPITGTVAVLTALFSWNDFYFPLIFLAGTNKQPLPVAIYGFVGEFAAQYNLIFAAVAITIAPMLLFYLFAQRQLIQGFSGGIRG